MLSYDTSEGTKAEFNVPIKTGVKGLLSRDFSRKWPQQGHTSVHLVAEGRPHRRLLLGSVFAPAGPDRSACSALPRKLAPARHQLTVHVWARGLSGPLHHRVLTGHSQDGFGPCCASLGTAGWSVSRRGRAARCAAHTPPTSLPVLPHATANGRCPFRWARLCSTDFGGIFLKHTVHTCRTSTAPLVTQFPSPLGLLSA